MAGLCLATCSNQKTSRAQASDVANVADETDLPLPAVPDSLGSTEERAAYMALHFWDAMDWKDHSQSLDTAFVEQNFANYLTVLPLADTASRAEAVRHLVTCAEADGAALAFLAETVSKYLYDPNSPMRDEELYILFARRMLGSGMLDDAGRMRMEAYLEEAVKNRPGSRAADFAYITRGGEKATLHTTAPGRTLLLIFYDPDCTHCAETIGRLGSDAGIIRQIDEGSLAVLAVYPDANTDLWQSTAGTLPERWIVGRAESPDDISDLYSIPATPVIYLLDPNRRVIAKDIQL